MHTPFTRLSKWLTKAKIGIAVAKVVTSGATNGKAEKVLRKVDVATEAADEVLAALDHAVQLIKQ